MTKFRAMLRMAMIICLMLTAGAGFAGEHLFILSGQSNMALMLPEHHFTPHIVPTLPNSIVVKRAWIGQPISGAWQFCGAFFRESAREQLRCGYLGCLRVFKAVFRGCGGYGPS